MDAENVLFRRTIFPLGAQLIGDGLVVTDSVDGRKMQEIQKMYAFYALMKSSVLN